MEEVIPVDAPPIDEESDATEVDRGKVNVELTLFDVDDYSAAPTIKQPADAVFAEYVSFRGAAGPDPRTVNIGPVADGLCAIIEAEGPMIAKRAYDVYLRGCGMPCCFDWALRCRALTLPLHAR